MSEQDLVFYSCWWDCMLVLNSNIDDWLCVGFLGHSPNLWFQL
jgi:hypothetical protein